MTHCLHLITVAGGHESKVEETGAHPFVPTDPTDLSQVAEGDSVIRMWNPDRIKPVVSGTPEVEARTSMIIDLLWEVFRSRADGAGHWKTRE